MSRTPLQDTITSPSTGIAAPSATVTIRDNTNLGALSTVYTASTGATEANNPISQGDTGFGSDGFLSVWLEPGTYSVEVDTGGVTREYSFTASSFGDAAGLSAIVSDANVDFSVDSRAALVAYWSDAKLPNGTTVSDGTVSYVAQSGATDISDLPGLVPLGAITPLHWQENTSPNTTDMATGFEGMFTYWETLTRTETDNSLFRSTIFGGSVSAEMHVPAGLYYTTYFWKPSTSAGRMMVLRGDGTTKTVIRMPVDGTADYFIEQQDRDPTSNAYHVVDIEGIKFIGGKGLYMNSEPDAPFVQRGVRLVDVDILGFTECAIGSLWADDPRWTLHRVRIETTSPNTKGIYFPRGVGNPSMIDVTIIGCTYRVVLSPNFQSTSFLSGLTMFSVPDDDHEADIWLKTIPNTSSNDGRGVIITGIRFSNENRDGKPVVLIADGDGTGTEITEGHSTSTSTRRFRDWMFTGNTVTGEGSADFSPAGPMIASYTTDIGAAEINGNSINAGFSELLWLSADPTGSKANGFKIGPNQFSGGGEAPAMCNRPFGLWYWGDGTETPASSTPLPGDGGLDPTYAIVNLNSSGGRISMGTAGSSSASLVAATDAYGFADARSVIYTASTGYVDFDADATQLAAVALEAGDNYFVEWEAKNAGSFNLDEVDVEILASMAGGNFTKRVSYRPTEGWRRNRIAIQLPEVPTGFRVRFYPSREKFSGTSDRTVLARPYFYRANRPFVSTPAELPALTVAGLPSASAAFAGRMVFVTNEAGGAVVAFSDGTNWRRVTDRAVVS